MNDSAEQESGVLGFIDARSCDGDVGGIDPWTSLVLGVPLALWSVRALRLALPAESIRVAGPRTAAPVIAGAGISLAGDTEAEELFAAALSGRGGVLIASPSAPFCTRRTAVHAVTGGVRELMSEQTGPFERMRVRDTAELAEADAAARGLPSGHAAIVGGRAFVSPGLGRVRAVICDVDGTLTDGRVTYSGTRPGGPHDPEPGEPGRSFDTRDGLALRLLQASGVPVAILSSTLRGESSRQRMSMLGVEHVDVAPGHKGDRFLALCEAVGWPPEAVAYLGDDVNDTPAMDLAGMVVCPCDAHAAVRSRADLVLEAEGGRGALREFADALLARLRFDGVLSESEAVV